MDSKIVIVALTLTGCAAASSEQIASSPDRYDVTCRSNLGNCHEEAASVCPNGYRVVDGADHSYAIAQQAGNATWVTPVFKGEIVVECQR